MPKVKNKCNVCGKVFPEGQGIVITVEEEVVALHSSRCAVKFLKAIIDELEPAVSKEVIGRVKKNFEEVLSKHMLSKSKRI